VRGVLLLDALVRPALASMERRNGGRRTSLAGTELQRQGKESLSVARQEAASVPPAPATPAAKTKIKELSSSLAQKDKAVVTMGHEMSEMRDRQARLKRELTQRQSKLEEATRGLSHAEAKGRKLENEKAQLQRVLQDVNRSREGLQEELSQRCARDFLDKVTIDDMASENATLTRRVTSLMVDLSHEVSSNKTLHRQVNTIEIELQRKENKVSSLSMELQASKDHCRGLRSQTASLMDELDRVGKAFGLDPSPVVQEGPPILSQGGMFTGF